MGRKSGVWQYVTRINTAQVECKNCSKILKWSRNTTNFWNHLKKHGIHKTAEAKEITAESGGQDAFPFVESIIETKRVEGNVEEEIKSEHAENESWKDHRIVQKKISKAHEKFAVMENKLKQSRICDKYHKSIKYPEDIKSEKPDDCAIFGSFIINEMRNLSSSNLRKTFKRKVLQALIDTSKDEDVININIPSTANVNVELSSQ